MSSLPYQPLVDLFGGVVFRRLTTADWERIQLSVRFGCATDTVNKTIERFISSVLLNLSEQQCSSGWENMIAPFLTLDPTQTHDHFDAGGWLAVPNQELSPFTAFVTSSVWSNDLIPIATIGPHVVNVGVNAVGYTYMVKPTPLLPLATNQYVGLGFVSTRDNGEDAINAFTAVEGVNGSIRLVPVWRIGTFQNVFYNAIALPTIAEILKAQRFDAPGSSYTGQLVSISLNNQTISVPRDGVLPAENASYGVPSSLIIPQLIVPPIILPPPTRPPITARPPPHRAPAVFVVPPPAQTSMDTPLLTFGIFVAIVAFLIIVTIVILGVMSTHRKG